MPPPSWLSPRSALDTAKESRELTDGRRTGGTMVESDVDRDWEFMAPLGRRCPVFYLCGICRPGYGSSTILGGARPLLEADKANGR